MVITGGEGSEDLVTEYSGIGLSRGKNSRFRYLFFSKYSWQMIVLTIGEDGTETLAEVVNNVSKKEN